MHDQWVQSLLGQAGYLNGSGHSEHDHQRHHRPLAKPIGDILDPDLYLGVIADMLTVCPDWSLAVPEFAESGDLHFIRWIATGTGPDGRFEFNGCDRVKTNASGQVCENYIFCDHPFFEQISASRGANKLRSLPRS